MTSSSVPAALLAAGAAVAVDVEVGAFSPDGLPGWGGILRGDPADLAVALRASGKVRLRFLDGQERLVRPAGRTRRDDQHHLLVPFVAEGPLPPE
ncbi:hypothetical protein ACWDCB_40490 [Streptomyces sp. NPDC001178]